MQKPSASLDLSKYKLSLVYSNDFTKPQEIVFEQNLTGKLASGEWIRTSTPGSRAVWIAEGRGGVDIRGGKLRVSPQPFDTSGIQMKDEPRSHMLSTGHKPTAADHPHPTFSPDGTRIEIESAMLSADGRSMNICIIPVPEDWLKRKY